MAEYLQSLPAGTPLPLFSLSTGQYLDPGLLCEDMQHQSGVVTLFVDAPPLGEPEPEPEPEPTPISEEVEPVFLQPSTRSTIAADDRRRVATTCQGSPDEEVLVRLAVSITRGDLKTLQAREWLNDKIINGYMDWINRRDLATHGQRRTIYAFSCFFYSQLSVQRYSYARVHNWTNEIDVFELERLLFPIHVKKKNHWCLAVINLKAQRFEYYDSLGYSNTQCLPRLRRWLQDESQDKHERAYSLAEWTDFQQKEKSQRNNYDCGVFTARAAECVARDVPLDFTQEDISSLRILMSVQLLDGTL